MSERDAVKEELTRAFEEKYSAFLTELKHMPVDTNEDKEQRWRFYMSHPMRDEFATELLEAYRPGPFGKLKDRLSNSHIACNADSDIASFRNKWEVDQVIFFTAVKKMVCNYTGINTEGNEYSFLAGVGTRYKQKAIQAVWIDMLDTMGVSDSRLSRGRKVKLTKTVSHLKKSLQNNMELESWEEELMKIISDQKLDWKPKKEEKELILQLALGGSLLVSVDKPMTEDGNTLGELLSDEENPYQEIEESSLENSFIEAFCRSIEDCWEDIKSAKGLREREVIRMFLTRDILKVLKLDEEGEPYKAEPAGDEEFYQSLESQGEFLYKKVFYKIYLYRAFIENPMDFYEVYVRLLRSDFNFSDRLLAEIEEKDPGTISRRRDSYVKWMQNFYRYYLNEYS